MKRWLPVVVCALSALARADVAKVFVDKGSTFVRSERQPLAVGTEVVMVRDAKGTQPAGKATVMEVWGPLARLALDDDAAGASAKFAQLPAAKRVAVAARAEPAPERRRLKGRAEKSLLRLTVYNEGDENWSGCELRFPDGRTFPQGELAAHSDDGVLLVKFAAPPDPPFDQVLMTCEEGQMRFRFATPNAPGALKGYAEHTGGGRVVVHNTGDTSWSRCDVAKPDGSHYLLGGLKAHDEDSIRASLFQKEPGPPLTSVLVRCKQGEAQFELR